MPLDPELKKQWVDALRSGEYKQTKGTLHNLDDGGFCCIGVACVVWGIATPEQMGVRQGDTDGDGYYLSGGPQCCYEDWQNVLMQTCTWDFVSPTQTNLTKMNDSGNYTFNEIADWIEEKL